MDKIKATLVLEILGKPAEHIKSALVSLIEKLGAEQGVAVIEKTIHEPSLVKDSKEIFTAFAEVSVEFNALENYFGILFAYMPSHVEITSPLNFSISNTDFNELGNKLLARLHDYDAITKKFVYERNFLLNKLREVAPNLFKEKTAPLNSDAPVVAGQPAKKEKKKKSPKESKK